SFFRPESVDTFFKPYNDWKTSLQKEHHLKIGGDYQSEYLHANPSNTDKDAFSGVLRLYSSYTAFNADSANSGTLIFKVENRHTYGDYHAAQNYGFAAGYYGIGGTLFGELSDSGWGLTNFFWKQQLREGKSNFIVGVIDPTDYLGIYGMSNPMTSFLNLSFLIDPTMFLPNQGLGVAGSTMIGEHFYAIANIIDANADAQELGFDTLGEGEFFTSFELGWTTEQSRVYFDNIHLTLWHVDEHSTFNASPEGWGANFSASWLIDDSWMPYLRGGYSKGGAGLMQKSLSAGFGHYMSDTSDLLGFGINWSDPSDEALREQVTAELFYRIQIAKSIALTPDIQYFKDPALYPTESSMVQLGLRARFTF
ncbi:MAG: carbohydrate porin, partial [Deltaproteobacteria bacterium]|nr:carbohydrate porin [Deltaproteobacteria bacterium]